MDLWARRKVMELDASLQLKEAEGINRAVEETRAKLNEIFRRQKVASHKQEQQQRQHSTKQQERREYQRQQDERWVPKVGDRVFVPRMNGSAKVVSIGGGEELVLQMGMLKVTAKVAEVRRP
ncbi:hypothetical protein WJX72_009523 [[Myrmecia] bisecta]|uniref:MutS2 and Smr-associated SH3 domain-containing protein n=1 Tax=[Myrmecia] bisecta TaxID=41462 RepID=A0AAW1QBV6_9CHLO